MLSSESETYKGDKWQATVDTSNDPHGLSVVHGWFAAWKNREFSKPTAIETAKKFIHEDYVLEHVGTLKNTDMFKTYKGPEGLISACQRLDEIDLHDFHPSFSVNVNEGEGTILVETTYTPTVRATGKTGKRVTDVHIWRVINGKIQSTKVFLANPTDMDSLFASADDADPVLVVKAVLGAWVAGELDKIKVVEDLVAQDCVFDATAAMKHTDMYKMYYGPAGIVDYVNRLKEIDFENFTPVFPESVNAAGEVIVHYSSIRTVKATGKTGQKMDDMGKWIVKDGKISSIKHYFGAPAELDELFVDDKGDKVNPVQLVKDFYRDRDDGKLETVTNVSKYLSRDCIIDASASMRYTDNFKVYRGANGMIEWDKSRKEIDFEDYTLTFPEAATNAGEVLVEATYVATVKATGQTGKKMTDLQRWTVREGKITGVKYYWESPKDLDRLYHKRVVSPMHFLWKSKSENKKAEPKLEEASSSAKDTATKAKDKTKDTATKAKDKTKDTATKHTHTLFSHKKRGSSSKGDTEEKGDTKEAHKSEP